MITVLIAEDDPMVAELNKQYVEAVPGFQTAAAAATPEEVLAAIQQTKPDLLLLDIYMPGMTGLELLEKMRAAGSETDVIVISAANDTASIQKALRYGAVDYLMKPFNFERFQKALLSYRERRQFFLGAGEVKQTEIDGMLYQSGKQAALVDLPKGLTKETLATVWESVEGGGEADFSAEDIAFSSGVSRVSVRKYLTFLQEAGILTVAVSYGSIGRPQTRYRINAANRERIKRFF
ncbi:response regulator [Bacillus aerolatus]|uniref:Response regulator n=1 Tax=Bacillus aerolatus TaxID=2653354 RepID=A0A6I1FAU2_9BACI|nr:response regulator [Bacillus aerolatus]KAB7704170.1 response regulator [Bacillus aerolatus]